MLLVVLTTPTCRHTHPHAGAITSGELTHCYLAERPDPWWQQLGTRCIHVTWSSRGTISLDGLALQVCRVRVCGGGGESGCFAARLGVPCWEVRERRRQAGLLTHHGKVRLRVKPTAATPDASLPRLQVVQDPQKADFILAHGTEAVGLPGGGTRDASLEQLGVLLEQCAAAARARGVQLPLICANPDMVTVDGALCVGVCGSRALAPGRTRQPVAVGLFGHLPNCCYWAELSCICLCSHRAKRAHHDAWHTGQAIPRPGWPRSADGQA